LGADGPVLSTEGREESGELGAFLFGMTDWQANRPWLTALSEARALTWGVRGLVERQRPAGKGGVL